MGYFRELVEASKWKWVPYNGFGALKNEKNGWQVKGDKSVNAFVEINKEYNVITATFHERMSGENDFDFDYFDEEEYDIIKKSFADVGFPFSKEVDKWFKENYKED